MTYLKCKFPGMYFITTIKLMCLAILIKEDCDGISFQMTEAGVSNCVANMAVRVVQSDLKGFSQVVWPWVS